MDAPSNDPRDGDQHSQMIEDERSSTKVSIAVNTVDEKSQEINANGSSPNSEAFSSSSEGSQDLGALQNNTEKPSEWDKALRIGKSSKGHASDFFTAPSSNSLPDEPSPSSNAEQKELESSSSSQTFTKENPPPPPPPLSSQNSFASNTTSTSNPPNNNGSSTIAQRPSTASTTTLSKPPRHSAISNTLKLPTNESLDAGVLPDVLMSMRQKIESLSLFDSDMMKLAAAEASPDDDPATLESRESLKRSSMQSISASVLVSLAHKRYERRRLAAMEIEKVVRALVQQDEYERVRAILLLLSDDYVRSTNEDARKGGVVALAACAIGLKKAQDKNEIVIECRDLILASVVHACQDHSQRVRYYATESLFNVVKVLPSLAVQHFFILFEILRSLYADVDADVRSGAELLDKKLKEVIVNAINSGSFTAEECVPVFARFVHIHNKATNRLTLTWLQELNEKLAGAPILEFLHLFLGGIFHMIADPAVAIQQSALAFLQSVLPKLLVVDKEPSMVGESDGSVKVDYDKILQALVTTMEHPDPYVRKVAMYWMSRIVKAHMSPNNEDGKDGGDASTLSAAAMSIRNSLPHVLPGIFLSIGDDFQPSGNAKNSFLPDQTTQDLAEQSNACLQEAVQRDGQAYVPFLDGFIVALREELDSPGGLGNKNPPAIERIPHRADVAPDGTGIESPGWFRGSVDTKERNDNAMVRSRLCALQWVSVLYNCVVPDSLKADYAREFVYPIIHQLVDDPPREIVYKSMEVLAIITVPVAGEEIVRNLSSSSLSVMWAQGSTQGTEDQASFPMSDLHVDYALDILPSDRKKLISRDREVFSTLIALHAQNEHLLGDLSNVIRHMCKLQPPEFIMASFAVELDRFIRMEQSSTDQNKRNPGEATGKEKRFSRTLKFVSSFIQHMCHALLNTREAIEIRNTLKDCIGSRTNSERDRKRARLFHILLHSFSHNIPATLALCLWAGAYKTASTFLFQIDPIDIHLMFFLEIDRLIEMLERPVFRHLHIRMLQPDQDSRREGSGSMLFKTLKAILMILPQTTSYNVLKDRLLSISRFRQSNMISEAELLPFKRPKNVTGETEMYVKRVLDVRKIHCESAWTQIRADSLEVTWREKQPSDGADRREWLGYNSKEEEEQTKERLRKKDSEGLTIEELHDEYRDLDTLMNETNQMGSLQPNTETAETSVENATWKSYWIGDKQ